MKALLILLISSNLLASPLDEMNKNLDVYKESTLLTCEESGSGGTDQGIFVDVSCRFSCTNQSPKMERVKSGFIPSKLGLEPGNGSTSKNIIWKAVGITLRNWSQKICIDKSSEACKGISNVDQSEVATLESGKWKISQFPSCSDKHLTVSPFDNDSGSIRMDQSSFSVLKGIKTDSFETESPSYQFEVAGLSLKLPLTDKPKIGCKHKIIGELCYGDCTDLNGKSNNEAIGTNEPLGTETAEICGDELAAQLKDKKLSPIVKQQVCEDFFWQSYSRGLNASICSAVRGVVDCKNL